MMPGPNLYLDGVSVKALVTKARTLTTQKTRPKPQTTQKQFDVTLKDLEEGRGQNIFTADNAQNVDISPPEPPPLFTLDQDRTLTYKELKELPDQKPAYYDPKTRTAYTGLGIFLTGMGSIVRKDIDPRKLDPLAKAEYYAGRAAAEVGLSYGLGTVLGDVIGRAPEIADIVTKSRAKPVVDVASKVLRPAKKVFSNPKVVKAVTGTLKGLFFGSEVAKGLEIKMQGGSWEDVLGTLGGDFAGMYAFEKGLTSSFATTRRNLIRKNFARRNSRIFAGQTYKKSPIIRNDPNQERLTTTLLKREEFPLEFKPRRPQAPYGTPKYDVVKLSREVPGNDALITGTINTKSKPRTTFRLETADDADDIIDASKLLKKARKQAKQLTTADEMKFLEQEKGLPEQLYTSDEKLWEELFKKESKKVSKPASGSSGEQKTVQVTKSILKKVNIGKAKASEAERAMKTKAEFYRLMKKAQQDIANAVRKLSGGSFVVGIANVPGLFEGPPRRIPEPPHHVQQPYWELDYNISQLKRELMKQGARQGQKIITLQKQDTALSSEPEYEYNINKLKEKLIHESKQEWTPVPTEVPEIMPPKEIQVPSPKETPFVPPKKIGQLPRAPPVGKLKPRKPRKPHIKPPFIPVPFSAEMFAGGSGTEGPWIGWGRENNTPLFTLTPIKIPNPFVPKSRGGRKRGIL